MSSLTTISQKKKTSADYGTLVNSWNIIAAQRDTSESIVAVFSVQFPYFKVPKTFVQYDGFSQQYETFIKCTIVSMFRVFHLLFILLAVLIGDLIHTVFLNYEFNIKARGQLPVWPPMGYRTRVRIGFSDSRFPIAPQKPNRSQRCGKGPAVPPSCYKMTSTYRRKWAGHGPSAKLHQRPESVLLTWVCFSLSGATWKLGCEMVPQFQKCYEGNHPCIL